MIYLDFEFYNSNERNLRLVSCVIYNPNTWGTRTFWLYDQKARGDLKVILEHQEVICSYNVTAEARALLSLGVDPLKVNWIDLYLEYRCLTNHNHKLQYGEQLIDGKVRKTSPPPKYKDDFTFGEDNHSKPQHSLAAACFKLLGEKIDTREKDIVRDIILSKDDNSINLNKSRILKYNHSDVELLPDLFRRINEEYIEVYPEIDSEQLLEEMYTRGDYAARTALMEAEGYPIDVKATKNFSSSVAEILWECQNEINGLFPEIKPFKKNKKRDYTWDQVATRKWVSEQGFEGWELTETGQLSLSVDAFKKFFPFRHTYPKDNFGAQMVRYLNLKQSLNGFSPTSKNSFWDYVGSDGRVRPYFGIYGAQSSRSQPKATGFLFLKAAWMRALVHPSEDKAICGIDYKSQEFLIAALLSRDDKMIEAYHSGDPYFYLAKEAGAVPKDAIKKDYKEVRDLFKSTTLGILYSMTKVGLARKLSSDMGRVVSEEEAQKLIDKFYEVFSKYKQFKKNTIRDYIKNRHIKLPCGWYMWADNDNDRSSANCLVQGYGASIMRKAVSLAQDEGLKVIMTLHDAIYIEYNFGEVSKPAILAKCMVKAFKFYFDETLSDLAEVGLESFCWSDNYGNYTSQFPLLGELTFSNKYIDERSLEEYNQFSKYFAERSFDL